MPPLCKALNFLHTQTFSAGLTAAKDPEDQSERAIPTPGRRATRTQERLRWTPRIKQKLTGWVQRGQNRPESVPLLPAVLAFLTSPRKATDIGDELLPESQAEGLDTCPQGASGKP